MKELYEEEDFLRRLSVAMDLMGYNTSLVETDDYPISIESKIVGYENLPVDFCGIFLPLQNVVGDEVQVLQCYISLYNQILEGDQIEKAVERCNFWNMNSILGTFGVQSTGQLCYKQAVVVRPEDGIEKSLRSAMDAIILMSINLDNCYDDIMGAILN